MHKCWNNKRDKRCNVLQARFEVLRKWFKMEAYHSDGKCFRVLGGRATGEQAPGCPVCTVWLCAEAWAMNLISFICFVGKIVCRATSVERPAATIWWELRPSFSLVVCTCLCTDAAVCCVAASLCVCVCVCTRANRFDWIHAYRWIG